MSRHWHSVPIVILLAAGCSSTLESNTTQHTAARAPVTTERATATHANPRVVDWQSVPPTRLDMKASATCTITGTVTLPGGEIVDTQTCTGRVSMPADIHIAEGWPRTSSTQSITDVIDHGDTTTLWLDGSRQTPNGWFTSDQNGQPVAYSVWVFQDRTGTHEIRVVWYRQNVAVITITITVDFGDGEPTPTTGDGGGVGVTPTGDTGITPTTGFELPPAVTPANQPDDSGAVSADLAFNSNADGDEEIYVMDINSGQVWRLTDNSASDIAPAWSTDGQRIAFSSNRDGNWELYTMRYDGTQQTRITYTPNWNESVPSWSNDNRRLAFDATVNGNQDIYTYELSSGLVTRCTADPARDGEPHFDRVPYSTAIIFSTFRNGNWDVYSTTCTQERQLTDETYLEGYGSFSADDEWFLYHSRMSGPMNVYLTNLAGSEFVVGDPSVSKMMPSWSPDYSKVVWQTSGRSDGTFICLTTLSNNATVCLVRAGTSQFAYPALR